jgi:hypothetical protein
MAEGTGGADELLGQAGGHRPFGDAQRHAGQQRRAGCSRSMISCVLLQRRSGVRADAPASAASGRRDGKFDVAGIGRG